jgi:choline dehydrogenase
VRYRADGPEQTATADREVILAAGAINSPKLLELSGIGDPEVLAGHGLAVRHALPGVGRNLQDHLQIRTMFRVSSARTLNQLVNSRFGKLRMATEYALFRRGPLAMAPSQLGIFARSDETAATPDLEYHIQPMTAERLGGPLHPFPAITVSVCNLRPESRGTCHVRSTDPLEQPEIRLNYLSAVKDRSVAVKAVRQARRLVGARALARYAPQEMLPGPAIDRDEALLTAIGNIATTIFHPVGSCRMGSDPMAVVDESLRVRGLAGIRVVDASIMPTITSGNTASPVVMIAEKAGDLIRNA